MEQCKCSLSTMCHYSSTACLSDNLSNCCRSVLSTSTGEQCVPKESPTIDQHRNEPSDLKRPTKSSVNINRPLKGSRHQTRKTIEEELLSRDEMVVQASNSELNVTNRYQSKSDNSYQAKSSKLLVPRLKPIPPPPPPPPPLPKSGLGSVKPQTSSNVHEYDDPNSSFLQVTTEKQLCQPETATTSNGTVSTKTVNDNPNDSTTNATSKSNSTFVFYLYLKKLFSIFRCRNRPADAKVQLILQKRNQSFYKRWSGATRVKLTGSKMKLYHYRVDPSRGVHYALPVAYPCTPVAYYFNNKQRKQILLQQFIRRHHQIMSSLAKKRFGVNKMFSKLNLVPKPRPQYQFLNYLLYQTVVRNNRMSGYRYGLIRPVNEDLVDQTKPPTSSATTKFSCSNYQRKSPKDEKTSLLYSRLSSKTDLKNILAKDIAQCDACCPYESNRHSNQMDSCHKPPHVPKSRRSNRHTIPQNTTDCIDCYLQQLSNISRRKATRSNCFNEVIKPRMDSYRRHPNSRYDSCCYNDRCSLSSFSDCCFCSLESSCGSSEEFDQNASIIHPKQWSISHRKKKMSEKKVNTDYFPSRISLPLLIGNQVDPCDTYYRTKAKSCCRSKKPKHYVDNSCSSRKHVTDNSAYIGHFSKRADYYSNIPKSVCFCAACAAKNNLTVANV